jgi:hypothetical protein
MDIIWIDVFLLSSKVPVPLRLVDPIEKKDTVNDNKVRHLDCFIFIISHNFAGNLLNNGQHFFTSWTSWASKQA